MNALVIGYGSIGKRHVEVLKKLGLTVSVISRRKLDIESYTTVTDALQNERFDYIVIANETVKHAETLNRILTANFKGKILVEKPLFMQVEYINNNVENVYVAYNLRYHPLLSELKKLLNNETVISVNSYVGQYLPTWRPNTDYTKSYSAFREQGGGVLRDLSHELDYLMHLFDEWTQLVATCSKISDLEIQSEDSVHVTYSTNNNAKIIVELNYLDRIIQRYLIVQTNKKTIKLDFINNTINCNGEIIQLESVNRNYTYEQQHVDILNQAQQCCTFSEGLKVMKMIEKIEQSSKLKEWVYND